MIRAMLVLCGLAVVSGCQTTPPIHAMGGSKADGTVDMAYEYGLFDEPTVDLQQAAATAADRCAAWGYNSAVPFNNGMHNCLAYNGYGSCIHTRVVITYQCVDE